MLIDYNFTFDCRFICPRMILGSIHQFSRAVDWLAIDFDATRGNFTRSISQEKRIKRDIRMVPTIKHDFVYDAVLKGKAFAWWKENIFEGLPGGMTSLKLEFVPRVTHHARLSFETTVGDVVATEKNYVPRNATCFATRGVKCNLVSLDELAFSQ